MRRRDASRAGVELYWLPLGAGGWFVPNADGPARGVLVEGPVFSRRLGRWRVFRYEVHCWPEG